MSTEILVEVGLVETRIALCRDGRLDELIVDRPFHAVPGGGGRTLVGSIHLGRVQRVVPAIDAAFVEIGQGRPGFLPLRPPRGMPGSDSDSGAPARSAVAGLCEGQAVLVQVTKDPIGGKGPRLTAEVTLPGRLLVLAPMGVGAEISRRITDEAERTRLRSATAEIAATVGMGLIVRTAALGAEDADLAADAATLAERWGTIQAAARAATAPAGLYVDIDPVSRALRDCADAEIGRVMVDDGDAYAAVRAFARDHAPELADRIVRAPPGTVFEAEGVEQEIARALGVRVSLPSGGWITIETTEALTAIDVNSGRFAESGGVEETGLRVNLEAATEIGRQLRVRGIGGLIVVDFIHMNRPEIVEPVLDALRAALAGDRQPTDLVFVPDTGLAVLTRKRVRPPLLHQLTERCAVCAGIGRTSTPMTVAGALFRRIEREARAAPGRPLRAAADAAVVGWLEAQPDLLDRLVRRIGAPVTWQTGGLGDRQAFDVWCAPPEEPMQEDVIRGAG